MKKKLRVGIIDLVDRSATTALFARLMNANLASIMPQVVGVWCEKLGHEVSYVCYTGRENLLNVLPRNVDVVFICAFTHAAQLAYALSNLFRSTGAVTVIGGPHARCFPGDSRRFFDYVLGFTDFETVEQVLEDCEPHRPLGVRLASANQPASLPSVRERWPFIEATLRKAPLIKLVPMLGSLGCPYTCSFCIDARIPYQPLDFDVIKDDLRFLLNKYRTPLVGWHDPNFAVRFSDYMDAIEEAIPQKRRIRFIAESSLSLLTEEHVQRLAKNGTIAMLPGIESWFDLGNKSKTGSATGTDKLERVADHVRMILRYIPYVQTNFVLGLDSDSGSAPFELTKQFVREVPAAFPGYSLLTAFGEAAPVNQDYFDDNRIVGFPFHFLNNHHAMNVRPLNYTWPQFYDHVIDLVGYSFSKRAIWRRLIKTKTSARWMNLIRAISKEGWGRYKYYREIRQRLDTDPEFGPFYAGESETVPGFFIERIRRDLGPFWDWLPEGALTYDLAECFATSKPAPDTFDIEVKTSECQPESAERAR